MNKGFREFLKKRRLALGLSQDQLAAATGLDKPRISRAECGHEVYFGDDALKALAGHLAVDADLLSLMAGKIVPHWRELAAENAEAALTFFRGLEQSESGQVWVAVPESRLPLVEVVIAKGDSIPQLVLALEAIAREQRLESAKAEYNPGEVPL